MDLPLKSRARRAGNPVVSQQNTVHSFPVLSFAVHSFAVQTSFPSNPL